MWTAALGNAPGAVAWVLDRVLSSLRGGDHLGSWGQGMGAGAAGQEPRVLLAEEPFRGWDMSWTSSSTAPEPQPEEFKLEPLSAGSPGLCLRE